MAKALLVHTESLTIERLYNTIGTAKAAVRRSKKRDGSIKYPPDTYSIMTRDEYNDRDVMVTVYNLMSGKPVQLRKSQVGGACDPSMERYWSM